MRWRALERLLERPDGSPEPSPHPSKYATTVATRPTPTATPAMTQPVRRAGSGLARALDPLGTGSGWDGASRTGATVEAGAADGISAWGWATGAGTGAEGLEATGCGPEATLAACASSAGRGASAMTVPPRGGSWAPRPAFTPGGGVSGGAAGVRRGAGAPNTVHPFASEPGRAPPPALGVATDWAAG